MIGEGMRQGGAAKCEPTNPSPHIQCTSIRHPSNVSSNVAPSSRLSLSLSPQSKHGSSAAALTAASSGLPSLLHGHHHLHHPHHGSSRIKDPLLAHVPSAALLHGAGVIGECKYYRVGYIQGVPQLVPQL